MGGLKVRRKYLDSSIDEGMLTRTLQWDNGRIIALLVLTGVLLIGFVFVQIYLPKTATIPPRIFKQRSLVAGSFTAMCTGSHMMIFGELCAPFNHEGRLTRDSLLSARMVPSNSGGLRC